jgi:hypothetical protein
LKDFAVLHRLSGQWALAAVDEQHAAAIKPKQPETKRLEQLETTSKFAMNFNPGLLILCARLDTQAHALADGFLLPPVPPAPPLILDSDTPPKPAPKDETSQARVLEQYAECLAAQDSLTSAAPHELGRALTMRLAAVDKSAARQTANRLIELYTKAANPSAVERIRAQMREASL